MSNMKGESPNGGVLVVIMLDIVGIIQSGAVNDLIGLTCRGGRISATDGRHTCRQANTGVICNDSPIIFSSLVVLMKGSDAEGLGIELIDLAGIEFLFGILGWAADAIF
jgi:hypothetical protein